MNNHEKNILRFVVELGDIVVKNGAEIQRTEQTIQKIVSRDGKYTAQAFVVPTYISVTISTEDGEAFTKTTVIHGRRVNLEKVIACDNVAIRYIYHREPLQQCIDELEAIDALTDFKTHVRIFSYSLISLAFTILFRGTVMDAFTAGIAGIFQGAAMEIMGKYDDLSPFFTNAIGSAIISAMAYIFYSIGIADNYNSVIIGSLMPLVPGFAITMAVRDLMYGDYVSGTAKIVEALLTSIGIAAGVITVLWLFGNVL